MYYRSTDTTLQYWPGAEIQQQHFRCSRFYIMTSTEHPTSFSTLCAMEGVFLRHLVPCLTGRDLAFLEATRSRPVFSAASAWKILCARDFVADDCRAPVFDEHQERFRVYEGAPNWKRAYQQWHFWQVWTRGGARAEHLVQTFAVLGRIKRWLQEQELHNVLDSFRPSVEPTTFDALSELNIPSSLVAFWSVHGGQANLRPRSPDSEFFAGLLGGYACYDHFYSMRLVDVAAVSVAALTNTAFGRDMLLVGISPGNPRMFLCLQPTKEDPEGSILLKTYEPDPQVVGIGGILSYLEAFADKLEAGVYDPAPIVPTLSTSRGISLYPNGGPALSCAVTHGIEVKASARWFPSGSTSDLNFGYSIRIRMLEGATHSTCQLVGRHWRFRDGCGNIRQVDGEGVIGKQPLFFRESDKCGFVDLGPGGDEERYPDTIFYYQSQSGPVHGTTPENTNGADVEGTFSFMPGSIDTPTGPLFHVTVATFPLAISFPFF